MTTATMLSSDFATLPELIRAHAAEQPDKPALAMDGDMLRYAALDRLMDRVATGLQRDDVEQRQSVAIVAAPSLSYAAAFLGALRAGCVATPLSPSATDGAIAAMIADCAVIGVPSEAWGETPIGFYVAHKNAGSSAAAILEWANAKVGKTQRLAALHETGELPRSAIGKVLKRELRNVLKQSA